MVIQVLRFVSPHPWGSHAAEGFRRLSRLERIVASLFDSTSDDTFKKRLAFSAGSHVLWTPVYVRPDGQLKHAKPVSGTDRWAEAWLASRSLPYRSANGVSGLEIDITSLILDKKPSTDPVEVLYDNRFVLTFNPNAIPDEVFGRLRASSARHRLVVAATRKDLLPRLVFRTLNGNTIEDIDMSSSPSVEPATTAPGIRGHLSGTGWAGWRLARVLE